MFKVLLKPEGDGAPVEVELERTAREQFASHIARVGGRRHEVELESFVPGEGWLRVQERVFPFYAVRTEDGVHVWLGGKTYRLEIVERTPKRAAEAAVGTRQAAIKAPMPGTVLKIQVRAGAAFEAHQPLIVLESMKMELTLSTPHAGRVKEILCTEGQLVEMGAVLAKLEESDDVDEVS